MTTNIKARGWLLTIFEQPEGKEKRTEEDIEHMLEPLPWVGQLEEGHETHHRHYQIYVEAPNPVHFTSLKRRCPDAHIEPRKGSKKQAFDYCSKQDTRISGPYFHGITEEDCKASNPGSRTDLKELSELITSGTSVDELLLNPDYSTSLSRCMNWARSLENATFSQRMARYRTEDRNVSVHYVWGEPGIGKTFSIKTRPGVFEPSYDGRWDDYKGEDTILFDEFSGQIPLYQMNRYLEGYRDTRLPARYHDSFACYHDVYIVSNYPPQHFYHHEESWLRRLTTIEHSTWYSLRNIGFARNEDEDTWSYLFASIENPESSGSSEDEGLWR
jgi:hypothetical protein